MIYVKSVDTTEFSPEALSIASERDGKLLFTTECHVVSFNKTSNEWTFTFDDAAERVITAMRGEKKCSCELFCRELYNNFRRMSIGRVHIGMLDNVLVVAMIEPGKLTYRALECL